MQDFWTNSTLMIDTYWYMTYDHSIFSGAMFGNILERIQQTWRIQRQIVLYELMVDAVNGERRWKCSCTILKACQQLITICLRGSSGIFVVEPCPRHQTNNLWQSHHQISSLKVQKLSWTKAVEQLLLRFLAPYVATWWRWRWKTAFNG